MIWVIRAVLVMGLCVGGVLTPTISEARFEVSDGAAAASSDDEVRDRISYIESSFKETNAYQHLWWRTWTVVFSAALAGHEGWAVAINEPEHDADTEVVMTLGSEGVCYQLGEQRIQLPAHRVNAVDTTAPGDTFIGYYLASQIDGMNIEDSLRRASTASALCVSREGAAPSIPGSSDVADALAEWPPLDALSN